MAVKYAGVDLPPPTRELWVHRVTTAETQQFVIISEVPYAQWIHYHSGRSCECYHPKAHCKRCVDGWARKVRVYLHVKEAGPGGRECFLEITPTASRAIESQIPEATNWRGLQVRMRKSKGGAKGRYIIDVMEKRIDSELLPRPADPLARLRFLWTFGRGPGNEA